MWGGASASPRTSPLCSATGPGRPAPPSDSRCIVRTSIALLFLVRSLTGCAAVSTPHFGRCRASPPHLREKFFRRKRPRPTRAPPIMPNVAGSGTEFTCP